jgi:hypothetical protein
MYALLSCLDRAQEKRFTDQEIDDIIGCDHATVANTRRRVLDANIPGGLQ